MSLLGADFEGASLRHVFAWRANPQPYTAWRKLESSNQMLPPSELVSMRIALVPLTVAIVETATERGPLDKATAPIAKCYERLCGRVGWR
jgi:hypothetical protein